MWHFPLRKTHSQYVCYYDDHFLEFLKISNSQHIQAPFIASITWLRDLYHKIFWYFAVLNQFWPPPELHQAPLKAACAPHYATFWDYSVASFHPSDDLPPSKTPGGPEVNEWCEIWTQKGSGSNVSARRFYRYDAQQHNGGFLWCISGTATLCFC